MIRAAAFFAGKRKTCILTMTSLTPRAVPASQPTMSASSAPNVTYLNPIR